MKKLLFLIILVWAKTMMAQIPTNGLVAYYPFSGNANDQSAYENNGTILGPQLTDDRFGNPNSAFLFNGINDYITVPNSESISLFENFNTEITICAWVNTFQSPLKQGIVGRWGGVEGIRYLLFILEEFGTTDLHLTTMGSPYSPGMAIGQNEWHFLVGLHDSNDDLIKTYLDGNLDKSSFSTSPFGTGPDIGKDLEIGRFDSGNYFKGKIDDIRIYNRALTQEEINAIYHENDWHVQVPLSNWAVLIGCLFIFLFTIRLIKRQVI
jgi:hypothetical protein